MDGVFGFDLVPDGRIVRNRLRHWDHGFSKERCNGILVVNGLGHMAAKTRNSDDDGGVIGESHADDAIVTAAFHLCDGGRSAEAYCDAEAVDFMLEG